MSVRDLHPPILFIVDEFPDMLLNLSRENEMLLREFLAWFRTQRQNPAPARDSIRWLVGGSVNLAGTLDGLGLVDRINDLEDVSLPPLTDGDVEAFVTEMLSGRDVPFDDDVAQRLIARLGRPIPLFMQMATQDLYRLWKREQRKIVAADVDTVFDTMIVGSAARTRLKHFHFEDQPILRGSETFDCPCLARPNQRERIGVEARSPVAGDGTSAGKSRRHSPGA